MSYILQDTALHTPGIFGVQKLVLIAIASYINQTGKSWPSVQTIAELIGMSTRTVNRHIADLLKKGYLVRIYRKGRSAITKLTDRVLNMLDLGQTPDSLSEPPLTDCQIEPVIGINQITAHSQNVSIAADAVIVVFEKKTPEVQQPTAAVPVLPLPATAATVTPVHSEPPPATATTVSPFADVPVQLIVDFGIVRKNKKKPAQITNTEAQVFAEQASIAGLTVAQAVRECVLRGWARFEASWLPAKPTEATSSVFVPETVQPVTPAIKAAGMAGLTALRSTMGASTDPLAWARDAVERDAAGERIGNALLRNARMALRI